MSMKFGHSNQYSAIIPTGTDQDPRAQLRSQENCGKYR